VAGKKSTTPEPPKKVDYEKLDKAVLDDKIRHEIVSVLKQHENKHKIFTEWGLEDTIEYGKGMTFLFHGPPGTGKTWTAQCIAKAIGQELMTISSAEIQSQEPGGAERNIQNAFAAAKKGKVLFLDECDSLITARSMVGMILGAEINTLLTEIEKFEGILILATNRIDTLDEALERRIGLIVEFKNPNFEQRQKIWEKLLPKKLPLGKCVDLEKLASFNLTGGQIKNVLLQAARTAVADDEKQVKLTHFTLAAERLMKSKNLMGTFKSSPWKNHMAPDDMISNIKKNKSSSVSLDLDKVQRDEKVPVKGGGKA
jgi:SpoVK/Ycf46/Vps4 family AAA+-type ATPase